MAGLGAGAACWPIVGRTQQPKIPRLGVLLYTSPQGDLSLESLKRGLAELGYVDGRSVAIEYRFAERRPERLPGLARELAALKPDVIVALGGDVAPFAVAAPGDIPIVFASSSDPVQSGLAASLGRPGGKATGVTFLLDDLPPSGSKCSRKRCRRSPPWRSSPTPTTWTTSTMLQSGRPRRWGSGYKVTTCEIQPSYPQRSRQRPTPASTRSMSCLRA